MSKDTKTHLVKLGRGASPTVISTGTEAECIFLAKRLNRVYQTDEYYVEPYRNGAKK